MISRMDADVGRLMKLLKQLNLDEKTLVIFTSDNEPHQECGHKHEFFDSNGDLTGYKRSMHEGGIRVPMIARWPGKIAAGTVSDHPSGFYDFLPTACELAGVEPPQDIDGISYLPALLGRKDQQEKHEYLYCASQEGATSVGVRYGKWKLVRYRSANGGKRKQQVAGNLEWRLYNLAEDIGEKNDLAGKHLEVVQKILSLLNRDALL